MEIILNNNVHKNLMINNNIKKYNETKSLFYASCLLNSAVFGCFFNVSFSSTVLMPPGTLFQLMGPWYANARCPYDFFLAAAMLRIFGSNDLASAIRCVEKCVSDIKTWMLSYKLQMNDDKTEASLITH